MVSSSFNFFHYLLRLFPIVLLFFLALVDFDFSVHPKRLVNLNLIYIVIYYWVLRKPGLIGYGVVFFVGIINDIVTGLPIGISSIDYLLLCGISSYFRNITLRPSLINEWIAFAPAILIINSIHFTVLYIFFPLDLNYYHLVLGSVFTFTVYPLSAVFFNYILKFINPIR